MLTAWKRFNSPRELYPFLHTVGRLWKELIREFQFPTGIISFSSVKTLRVRHSAKVRFNSPRELYPFLPLRLSFIKIFVPSAVSIPHGNYILFFKILLYRNYSERIRRFNSPRELYPFLQKIIDEYTRQKPYVSIPHGNYILFFEQLVDWLALRCLMFQFPTGIISFSSNAGRKRLIKSIILDVSIPHGNYILFFQSHSDTCLLVPVVSFQFPTGIISFSSWSELSCTR